MIKHIVMWRLFEQAEGNSKADNAIKIKEILEGLNGKIPGLLHLEVGIDFSNTDASGDVVLYSELESKEALSVYQQHPEHVAAAKFIGAVCKERQLVDYEV
jgi:hypothetical protein